MKYICLVALLIVGAATRSNGKSNKQVRDGDGPCAGKPNGYYVNNPVTCRAFWMCQNDLATSINCPVGQHFNEPAQICDLPQNYPCVDGKIPDGNATTLPPEPSTDEPFNESRVCKNRPDGYFVNNPINCAAFWICSNRLPHDGACNDGMNFNEEMQVCDTPENFFCEESETPETTDPADPTDEPTTETVESTTLPARRPFECPDNEMASFPIPDTCTTYRLCFGGSFKIQRCADGLHFDEVSGQCDFADRIKCTRGLCPAENDIDHIVTHPSENSCNEFFVCFDGELQLRRCPDGLMWNQQFGQCEHSFNVRCKHSEPEEPFTVECPGEEVPKPHIIPHPRTCREYFICSMDVPYHRICPQDLLFDQVLQTCNIPELVDCRK